MYYDEEQDKDQNHDDNLETNGKIEITSQSLYPFSIFLLSPARLSLFQLCKRRKQRLHMTCTPLTFYIVHFTLSHYFVERCIKWNWIDTGGLIVVEVMKKWIKYCQLLIKAKSVIVLHVIRLYFEFVTWNLSIKSYTLHLMWHEIQNTNQLQWHCKIHPPKCKTYLSKHTRQTTR